MELVRIGKRYTQITKILSSGYLAKKLGQPIFFRLAFIILRLGFFRLPNPICYYFESILNCVVRHEIYQWPYLQIGQGKPTTAGDFRLVQPTLKIVASFFVDLLMYYAAKSFGRQGAPMML